MAAYAALVSLTNTIDDLHRHPRPPISLHKEQVASLTAKLNFLQEFLESYNPHLSYRAEADHLEIRIADAAYAAEDAIETQIADTITKKRSSDFLCPALQKAIQEMAAITITKKRSSGALNPALQKVIQEMAAIEKVAMEIKETQQQRTSTLPPPSSSISQKKSTMVGADDLLLPLKDRLTSNARALQFIPVVGMGGSGKTSLALNIYHDRLIVEHFDIRAWATISQEYNIRQILIDVLKQLNKEFNQDYLSEGELGDMLHKQLFGRRYLIIMDDMWIIDAWDRIRNFFPNNINGSRIIVTTRLSNLASSLPNSNGLEMSLLDEAHSWNLLSKTVFGEKGCPSGLEDIGKKIGKSCKGLPLSIVAVGGILAKSVHTRKFWKDIEKNLNSIVNLEDDERCLKILYMSYKQLPVHLKPCFLYMGVFREDEAIRVSRLLRFWVAEGFLKAESGKSLEAIGKEYIKDLIDRNLIMIHKVGSIGSIKECKVHDLLRDMCLREAQKERFYCVLTKAPSRQDVQRRIVIPKTISKEEVVKVLSSMSHARSLIWDHEYAEPPLNFNFMLLRILHTYEAPEGFFKTGHRMVNARLLTLTHQSLTTTTQYLWLWRQSRTASLVRLVWNLQTLCVSGSFTTLPTDIWYMPHIRHLDFPFRCRLPDPPPGDDIVWENLQTLKGIENLRCSKRVVKIIRNIKKLRIEYNEHGLEGDRYCLTNLDCLDKLESLWCSFCSNCVPSSLKSLINFPHSLKKLTIYMNESPCSEEILEKIGVLPNLEKLRLLGAGFKEREWETIEDQFPSLKYLYLGRCKGLKVWTIESSHFPRLEHLLLDWIQEMEIPLEFAEVSTLRLIELGFCQPRVMRSARRILDEHEELYGKEEATLQVKFE